MRSNSFFLRRSHAAVAGVVAEITTVAMETTEVIVTAVGMVVEVATLMVVVLMVLKEANVSRVDLEEMIIPINTPVSQPLNSRSQPQQTSLPELSKIRPMLLGPRNTISTTAHSPRLR